MAERRRFEWDEAKARANEAKHGLSFRVAVAAFDDSNRLEFMHRVPKTAKSRSKVIGMIDGSLYTVVFVMRGESYRIISARRSNRREERSYGDRSLHT